MFQTLHIRARSTGPQRRAGLILTPIGSWIEHTLDDGDQIVTAQTLKALIADPAITVELGEAKPDGDGYNWHPAPPLEALDEVIAALSVLDQAAQAPDPEDAQDTPPQSEGAEEAQPQPDAGAGSAEGAAAPTNGGDHAATDNQPEPAEVVSPEPNAPESGSEAGDAPAPVPATKPAKAPKAK
jgi:hypothetical protein